MLPEVKSIQELRSKLNSRHTTYKRMKQMTYVFQRAQPKTSEAITSVLDFSSKNNRAS